MGFKFPSEGDSETLDILTDIYGDEFERDISFDFVNKSFQDSNDSYNRFNKFDSSSFLSTHSTSFQRPLQFYPLNSFTSYGYSCLDILDLSRIFCTSGTHNFNLRNTLYYQMCKDDKYKLYKSHEELYSGENFAARCTFYTTTNPPLYLKYYTKDDSQGDTVRNDLLLSEPIEDLFRKVFESELYDDEYKKSRRERIVKRKKKKSKTTPDDGTKKQNWVYKYKPEFFPDLLTSENINLECLRWLSSWKCAVNYLPKYTEPENRILLIGGPAGVGKTCLVNVLAKHCGYNVVEINSSDDRTKGRVVPIINGVVSAGSVDPKKPNLCLLEDVDTLMGSELSIIAHLKQINSKKTAKGPFIKRPIVCTCTDVYARQLKELRDISKVVIIESCDTTLLQNRLEWVLEEEGLVIEDQYLKEIQEAYKYDIRSCLTVLEFITNYSGKYGRLSLSDLTKDTHEGVSKLLKSVFSENKINLHDIEKLLMATVNSLGYNYTTSVIGENMTQLPMKRYDHLWKLSIIQDTIAQSDVLCNHYGSPVQTIQLLKVCCGFINSFVCNKMFMYNKFVYPQKTGFHTFNIKYSKSKNLIHSFQKSSSPIVSQGTLSINFTTDLLPFILKFLCTSNKTILTQSLPFIIRVIKGLEGCWEGLFPFGSIKFPLSVYPLIHSTQLIVLYGISIVNVNQMTIYDPPIFELYIKTSEHDHFNQIPDKFSQLIQNFIEFYKTGNKSYFTDDTHFKGSASYNTPNFVHFFEAIKFIYNKGYEEFKTFNKVVEKVDIEESSQVMCKRTHQDILPVLFSQILVNDSSFLREFSKKRKKSSIRTYGNYKYQDQNCSAVRYIINQF